MNEQKTGRGLNMAETEHGCYFVEEIAEGIYKIYEQREASIYLIAGGERACLIDTAYGLSNLKELVGKYTDLPVTVVNTHGHIDHMLGNHWFDNAYLNTSDRFMYNEIVFDFSMLINEPWVQDFYGDFVKNIDPEEVHFPVAQDISDGDVIDLGGKSLEIYAMPGHTKGSIVVVDRSAKICFSGDSIIENLWLFLEESEPPEVYLNSLKRIREVLINAGIEKIYSGHFSYEPIPVSMLDTMVEAMELTVSGRLEGVMVENHAGKGIEYSYNGWKVICPLKAQ